MLIYDPPEGWRYGFPKAYKPNPGESIEETLRRDGYPEECIKRGWARHCRFIGDFEELQNLPNSTSQEKEETHWQGS